VCRFFRASVITAGSQPFQARSLNDFLEAKNWIVLPIPDNKMRPGAVIKVTKNGEKVDVTWLADFRTCGLTDKDLGFIRGKSPSDTSTAEFAVKASVVASFLSKLGGSADLNKVNRGILKIDDSGADAIDLLALQIWLARPGNLQALPAACTSFLGQPDIYLVSQAFRITKGTYQLLDENGGKVSASGATPAGISTRAEIGGTVSSTGALDVTEDFYFAVRCVKVITHPSAAV
jgi:hypothetical protein